MSQPDTTPVFVFGTLRDATLRRIVLGEDVQGAPATLPGADVRCVAQGDWPVLAFEGAGEAEGVLLALSDAALARGDYYEALFGYTRVPERVLVRGVPREVQAWRPQQDAPARDAPWALEEWQARHAPLARAAAQEALALFGQRPATETARRWPVIKARAQARLNARAGGPTTLRRSTGPDDVEVSARRTPYAGFFAVEEYDLRHARFDGTVSPWLTRAAFVSADAVTVLPYDPARDVVLLIEQFRAGPFARGDSQCWSLEAIAGRIDPGETPDETARREAREEAGLELGALIPLAAYYPTPGAKSEFLYSFLAIADLPRSAEGLGGLESEHEDIRAHVIAYTRLEELIGSGEINNAPLLLSAMALAGRRPALREGHGQAG